MGRAPMYASWPFLLPVRQGKIPLLGANACGLDFPQARILEICGRSFRILLIHLLVAIHAHVARAPDDPYCPSRLAQFVDLVDDAAQDELAGGSGGAGASIGGNGECSSSVKCTIMVIVLNTYMHPACNGKDGQRSGNLRCSRFE